MCWTLQQGFREPIQPSETKRRLMVSGCSRRRSGGRLFVPERAQGRAQHPARQSQIEAADPGGLIRRVNPRAWRKSRNPCREGLAYPGAGSVPRARRGGVEDARGRLRRAGQMERWDRGGCAMPWSVSKQLPEMNDDRIRIGRCGELDHEAATSRIDARVLDLRACAQCLEDRLGGGGIDAPQIGNHQAQASGNTMADLQHRASSLSRVSRDHYNIEIDSLLQVMPNCVLAGPCLRCQTRREWPCAHLASGSRWVRCRGPCRRSNCVTRMPQRIRPRA